MAYEPWRHALGAIIAKVTTFYFNIVNIYLNNKQLIYVWASDDGRPES